MTGVQLYVVRVEGEDRLIAAVNAIDAIEADYRRFIAESVEIAEQAGAAVDSTWACYSGIFEEVVAAGEIELFTASALAQLDEDDS